MKDSIFQTVYELVKQIPPGKVSTYGQIAFLLGNPRLSRVVGYALHGNRDPEVPCHRVVNRKGELASAFLVDGVQEQRLLLEIEGVPFTGEGTVALSRCLWEGPASEI